MESDEARKAQEALQTVTQDLQSLHKGLVAQLSQEVVRLQAEKTRLMADIEKLQAYHRALQSRQLESFSQQQVAQQQLWAKQLAQILASHLQAQIAERLNQIAAQANQSALTAQMDPAALPAVSSYSENAQRLLASLDATFNDTFKTLQQELTTYQSALSHQINRMQTLEQQGEAILEALINRLREQLHADSARMPISPSSYPEAGHHPPLTENPYPPPPAQNYPPTSGTPYPPLPSESGLPLPPEYSSQVSNGAPPAAINGPVDQVRHGHSRPTPARPSTLSFPATPAPLPAKPKKEASLFQLGLVLVLISTVALSFHNVVVRIIGTKSVILGWFSLGGFIQLNLGNSILILWLRMLVVLPLMIVVAMILHPPVWRDIRRFFSSKDRRPIFSVVGSGLFLFLSQILIYVAIGSIGAGPAVTILFMYPIVTVPLAWVLFGDRPTRLRWIVMATILLGVILTAQPNLATTNNVSGGGVLTAVFAGIAFAFYLLLMQLGFKKLHPIPVSLIQFFTIFTLTSVILVLSPNLGIQVEEPRGFILGGIVLGALTLIGYLTNNFGVRFMGAARASIIASSGPVMTAFLAWLIIQSPLQFVQVLGILLVTGGVTALSFERMKSQPQPARVVPGNGRQ
ncbi:EamA family transporter [Leptothermofonsia sichuanensis E412]|uniref:EamA family transporter n=1 Tax=Leptothermofonsia sichuanensis TaxID=2917832 RepID=UPI001CA794AE|nr:EamA family transporter [Leptothermofonsia sichuanensis]QZZ22275.1 EamA family transporter [Leptothermofonsia sichuanensis E412]